MPTHDRRDAAGRRAGSRGPKILRFEPLEGRQLLSASAEAVAAGARAPDLVAVSFRSEPYGDLGHELKVGGTLRNQGTADADTPFKVDVYVSTAADRSTGAVKMGSIAFDGLEAGADEAFEAVFDLPPTGVPGIGADNAVHIGLVVDAGDAVAESNTANNLDRGVGVDSAIVIVVPHQPASLAIRSVRFDQDTLAWGDSVRVTARVENTLGGAAEASTARVVLTPPGVAVGSGQEVTLVGDLEVPELLPYQSVDVTAVVRLPEGAPKDFPGAGGYIARVVADADHDVTPALTAQPPQARGVDWEVLAISPDPAAEPIDPAAPRPDLAPSDVLTPGATLTWGGTFQVASTITNQGQADSGPVKLRYLLGGPNGELANALVLGHGEIPAGIAAGASATVSQELKLPGKLPFGLQLGNGLGRVIVQVDPENTIDEADEADNMFGSAPMTLAIPTPVGPDSPYSPATPTPSPDPQPTPNPRSPIVRPDQQQRIQLYRARLQAFRQLLEQRRQAQLDRMPSRPSPFPGGRPGGFPSNG